MKNIILIPVLLISFAAAQAQPAKTAAAKPPLPVLKNMNDSASYAIGVSVANYYKQMGVKTLNTSLVSKAINDILTGKKALIDDNACNSLMNTYLTKLMAEKSKGTIEAGEKFLAENKLKPGIITTASGLQYEVINEGTGIKPTGQDSVTCHYRGTFIDGKGFDNSYDRGEPITFALGGVIKGWTEGLQLMSVGSKYKFYVPYQLGYGPSDYMSIPGGSVLIFEVELLDVKKKQ
jgi:FKBP-type peptidyl-prolyl cis-trans isomerase FklB